MAVNIFYGETNCQKPNCRNKAYYTLNNGYYCGTHSRNQERNQLPERPKAEIEKMKSDKMISDRQEVERSRIANNQNGKPGNIILSKLRMMTAPDDIPGYLKVFPNFKHQNRQDGFGCSRLSPMSLGPIHHMQPGLPPAKNLENFYQGSKCFLGEMTNGIPSAIFHQNRLQWYQDSTPHRHKIKGEKPAFFVWVDKEGKEYHLDYINSRQFYCKFYEELASKEEDFAKLKYWRSLGYNLQICGYDADPASDMDLAYLDPSKPFGHEKVLLCLLLGIAPWRKYGNLI